MSKKSKPIPLWLQSKEYIEAYLAGYLQVDNVTIISGLETDRPIINSPKELVRVDVRKKNTEINIREDCRRASEEFGITIGMREALLCWKQWEKTHESWRPFETVHTCFVNAIVKIEGLTCVMSLPPIVNTHLQMFIPLDSPDWGDRAGWEKTKFASLPKE